MRETPLLLEGVNPDRISVGFLVDVMDVAQRHGLSIEGISILRGEYGDGLFADRWP